MSSEIVSLINIVFVRGIGIRDISAVLGIRAAKVSETLKSAKYKIKPMFSYYDYLEVDGFWIYGGKKRINYGLSMRITGKAER